MAAPGFSLRAILATVCAVALGARLTMADAPAPTPDSTYRSGVAEKALRTQTDAVRVQIEAMIAEMKANGLDTSELQLLDKAGGKLDTMSKDEFEKVLASLQAAITTPKPEDRQQALAKAFDGQKNIALQLKTLAEYLAAQELRKELPAKLENLITRQAANMRKTAALAATSPASDAQQKANHDIASSEQAAIDSELALIKKALAAAATVNDPDAGDTAEAAKAELDQMNANGTMDAADKAKQLTATGAPPDATTSQQAVRDKLVDLLHLALSKTDEESRLADAKAQTDSLMTDQKALTKAAQNGKMDSPAQAERQGQLNDRATVVQALVQPLSTPAADHVADAQKNMAQSASKLANAKDQPQAAEPAKQAASDLQKADALLDQQLAAVEKEQNLPPTDQLSKLEQLKNDIDQTQKSEQPAAADLQKLQQEAVPTSPEAANKIADAASKMQQATPDTAGAHEKLAQAGDAVQKQMAAMAPMAAAYQKLQDASTQLAQAQAEAQSAQQSMQGSHFTPAAHDLTQAQGQVQGLTGQGAVPAAAKDALKDAQGSLGQAATQAVQAHGAEAQGHNGRAMAAMQKAQDALQQAMAQIQAMGAGSGSGQGQGMGQGSGQGTGSMAASMGGIQGQSSGDTANVHGLLTGAGRSGGPGQVMGGLSSKDRDAIAQFQNEKSPPAYSAEVQQYLKNLADTAQNH